jgi:ABC-2 type transport system ATP-binding protein
MHQKRPLDSAVVVDGLVKRYREREKPALDGLSFSVHRGEVFGLLGPNGAGKSTTIGILTTRVAPTAGRALVEGVDVVAHPARARRNFAVVPQRNNLDRSLTLRQNLLFHAGYHGLSGAERRRLADEALEWMGLTDRGGDRGDELSGGQAQRVMIARALMHRPDVLFLDEPATGLDPQARLFIHERVTELTQRGVTVVITTHDMDEAAKLCDRVGIVDHGTLLALDTPQGLMSKLSRTAITVNVQPVPIGASITTGRPGSGRHRAVPENRAGGSDEAVIDPETVVRELEKLELITRVELMHQEDVDKQDGLPPPIRLRLYSDAPSGAILPIAIAAVTEARCDIKDISIGSATLEDVFIELTGRELR